jgi:riboflavin synthase
VFTGIIEELGTVEALAPRGAGARITVRCKAVLEDAGLGSSISVNGVCLTAAELRADAFSADVAPETMSRSNLEALKAGSVVNLERPLAPQGRLGGHIVQGHVDATGEVHSLEELGDGNWWLTIVVPAEVDPYLVEKGSIAIDGISLTIAKLEGELASVTVIPHTFENTTLRGYRPGSKVNIETDIIAKHVAKLLGRTGQKPGLSVEKLRDMGY